MEDDAFTFEKFMKKHLRHLGEQKWVFGVFWRHLCGGKIVTYCQVWIDADIMDVSFLV